MADRAQPIAADQDPTRLAGFREAAAMHADDMADLAAAQNEYEHFGTGDWPTFWEEHQRSRPKSLSVQWVETPEERARTQQAIAASEAAYPDWNYPEHASATGAATRSFAERSGDADRRAQFPDDPEKSAAATPESGRLSQPQGLPAVPPLLRDRYLGPGYAQDLEEMVRSERATLAAAGLSPPALKKISRDQAGALSQLSLRLCKKDRELDAEVDRLLETARPAHEHAGYLEEEAFVHPEAQQALGRKEQGASRAQIKLRAVLAERTALRSDPRHPDQWFYHLDPSAPGDPPRSQAAVWARGRAADQLLQERERQEPQQSAEQTLELPDRMTVEPPGQASLNAPGPGLDLG